MRKKRNSKDCLSLETSLLLDMEIVVSDSDPRIIGYLDMLKGLKME